MTYRIIGITFKWYIRVVDAHQLVKRVVESLTCLGYGIGSGAVWTITIRVLVKAGFYGRHEQYRLVYHKRITRTGTLVRYLSRISGTCPYDS